MKAEKAIKNLLFLSLLGLFLYACSGTRGTSLPDLSAYDEDTTSMANDTVRIANEELEYEIIIIEPGFSSFLISRAQPEGYYSQEYLENKNNFLVSDYNARVRQPFRYNPDIYVQEINYDPNIDYGYEVNYKLYYYFVFLNYRYGERFSVPTRL